mgnify:CR=1 FL=1
MASSFYYLKKSEYVIGINSTVLIEALPLSKVIVIKHGWYGEMIEFIEATPDTIISLISGKKIMVGEAIDLVAKRVVDYRKRCNEPLCSSA